jgi:hypothetical protein
MTLTQTPADRAALLVEAIATTVIPTTAQTIADSDTDYCAHVAALVRRTTVHFDARYRVIVRNPAPAVTPLLPAILTAARLAVAEVAGGLLGEQFDIGGEITASPLQAVLSW